MGDVTRLSDPRLKMGEGLFVCSPLDRQVHINVRPDNNHMKRLAGLFQTNKIYEFIYLICGQKPPVNNIGYHERGNATLTSHKWQGISQSTCLFRGIRRPREHDGGDGVVYIYVITPPHTYRFIADMVCPAKMVPAPLNCVFVAYVKFEPDFSSGTILDWEWISSPCGQKPENFDTRYDEELWL